MSRGGRRPGRSRIAAILEAEGGLDGGEVVGEAPAVFLGGGRLAGALSQLALHPHQLGQQAATGVAASTVQVVLDAGTVGAQFPVPLELIGHLVDPGPVAGLGQSPGGYPLVGGDSIRLSARSPLRGLILGRATEPC
jgi:hypothetical protein